MFATMVMVAAVSFGGSCPCPPGCDCGPVCGCCSEPSALAVKLPAGQSPQPPSVMDRVAELEKTQAAFAAELRAVKADVAAVKADVATGVAEIKELLKGRPAAAATPAADDTAAVLRSIDASLKQLVTQRQTAAARGSAAAAPFGVPAPSTTPGTSVPVAGPVSSSSPDGTPPVTYTLAGGAGSAGGTSGGCGAAGCAASGGSGARAGRGWGVFGGRRAR